jgi:hypothetical protein
VTDQNLPINSLGRRMLTWFSIMPKLLYKETPTLRFPGGGPGSERYSN